MRGNNRLQVRKLLDKHAGKAPLIPIEARGGGKSGINLSRGAGTIIENCPDFSREIVAWSGEGHGVKFIKFRPFRFGHGNRRSSPATG